MATTTPITVTVKCSTGDKFTIEVDPKIIVSEFKVLLADKAKIPAAQQRLIYSGHVLKDPQTLESYSLKDGSTIHLVRGAAPPSTTAPSSTTPTPNAAPTSSQSAQAPSPGLDFFGGFPGFGAGSSLEQMMQNPSIMRDMMNSPMMQNIMQNPEIIRSLLANNPQIREIIERNPEVGHLINDPQILRQTMEMARNPELMREMMRNTDRAMSNIESHPEGFNLLRQMYTNVQEPMMNAATQQAQAAGGLFTTQPAQNPSAPSPSPSPNPNTAPLPNPWAPPSTTPANAQGANAAASTLPPMDFGDFGNLGGLGNMGMGMPGGDLGSISTLLQNPNIQQMMQQMLSNPELMQQMFDSNPMARQMMDANPQLRQLLQNPDFVRQLTNPQNLQAMIQMQQAMQQLRGGQGGGLFGLLGNTGLGGMDWNMFGGPFGGAQGAATAPQQQPSQPQAPPEERFRVQLQQLQEMGFTDQQANITALLATNGFVQAAIERLLNS